METHIYIRCVRRKTRLTTNGTEQRIDQIAIASQERASASRKEKEREIKRDRNSSSSNNTFRTSEAATARNRV